MPGEMAKPCTATSHHERDHLRNTHKQASASASPSLVKDNFLHSSVKESSRQWGGAQCNQVGVATMNKAGGLY